VKGSFRGFILDADNTLFDFDRAEADALGETLEVCGVTPFPPEAPRLYHRINEELWKEFEAGGIGQAQLRRERFSRLLDLLGEPAAAADAGRLSAVYLRVLARKAYLKPHARAVLRALSRRASAVLLTNGIPEVQRRRLAESGLLPFLRGVVISGEVGLAKPDVRIFRLALRHVALPGRKVLCVGDSPSSDIRGASSAGLAACWVAAPGQPYPPEEPPPEFTVHDLRQLLELMG
jgi:2-haloacid dehalogenase